MARGGGKQLMSVERSMAAPVGQDMPKMGKSSQNALDTWS